MNSDVNKVRKSNPKDKANILSTIFLGFVFKTIWNGARRNLEDNDICEVVKCCQSEKLGDRLGKEWERELKKKNPSLLCAMFRIVCIKYFLLSIFIFLYETTLITVLEPILIGKITSYFESGQNMTIQEGTIYVVALTVSSVILCLCNNIFLLTLLTLCLQMRIAITSLVYRKCLKLHSVNTSTFNAGKAINLITKDVLQFFDAADCAQMIIVGIPQFCVMTVVAYYQIQEAALAGVSIIFILLPLNVYLGKLVSKYRLRTAAETDQRIKITQEVLTAVRTIKFYTWELFFSKSVNALRQKEITNLRILFYIKSLASSIGEFSSRLAFYICMMTYIALGNHITAEKAFIVVGCFGAVHAVLTTYMPTGITQIADMGASLQRITKFLLLEEVQEATNCNCADLPRILVKNVVLKNDKNVNNISLNIKKGLTVILGPSGSGKSTLLKLILGDVFKNVGEVEVNGTISYASQEPWLFPATIRQNILFGEIFDKTRYEKVLEVCALQKDFEVFPNGDKTVVTDRGLNVSKGQKIRINLARAVYRKASIYLLDDCLSSIDSRVGSHIFKQCIKGFLSDSICVLITHNLLLMSAADNLLILNKGSVRFFGDYKSFKTRSDGDLKPFKGCYEITRNNSKPKVDPDTAFDCNGNSNNKVFGLQNSTKENFNLYDETNQVGTVNRKVYYEYFASAGGLKVFVLVIFFCVVAQATASWTDYFVSFWVDMEQELSGFRLNQTTNSSEFINLEKSHNSVLKSYSFVMLAAAIFTFLRSFMFYIFSSKASNNIHKIVFDRVLNGRMTFFDCNLFGNVLNRFSRDLGIIDEQMPRVIFECIHFVLSVFAVFFVVSSINLYFVIPSAIFAIVLYFARQLYIPTGRSLRRLEGATRSPVIGHLSATVEGLTTIRARQIQNILKMEFDKHQDAYSSVVYTSIVTERAFGLYLDLSCACYIAVITFIFLFCKTDTLVGKIGLAITQSFSLTQIFQSGIRQWAELENQMTSTERFLDYKNVAVENTFGKTISQWPKQGSIVYKNVYLKYTKNQENVLKNICFKIGPKEKIAVVGRTGAGKTSLLSTLFRMYDFEGTIMVDGIDITSITINHLRSKISIIPQDPVLFSGTIRSNLDPYSEYSDEVLWGALDEVGLKSFINSLHLNICEGSADMSVGERQLFCLARAVVRRNNILILDEATANVDAETDLLIHSTITKLFSNCTIITITHKLHTVWESDQVLVMDSGEIVQHGPPKVLLEDKSSFFYRMIEDAGLQNLH
ncbi:hypothetical protein FQA39_LY15927 [Lamprigera yunnana]|nr:hypothetical protein FQA39_LY15927 [Lamprigera yunnana]